MIRHTQQILALTGFSLFLCLAPAAFSQGNSTPAQETPISLNPPSPPAASDKPKKVWTNEDVKSAGSVSVIGDARNQKYTMTKPADPATVAKYKANLKKLQDQLDDVNKKLQAYQDFEHGKASPDSGRDISHGYSRTPVDQEVAKLQEKKKQLEQHMDELYDEARKLGIESGQLK